MAHPKRKHSQQRGAKRRSHDAIGLASLSECPQCGNKLIPHRICDECGYYKGRAVVTIKAKKEKSADA